MKIDRHTLRDQESDVKLRSKVRLPAFGLICAFAVCLASNTTAGAQQKIPSLATHTANAAKTESQPTAVKLLNQVVQRIALGPAFGAKVRQRVWTAGREVIGVGIYEQAGAGTGRFNLHISMHDGDGKHTLQQISDGRLTWTRTIIADQVSLKRVDVGRLDEWVRSSPEHEGELPPRLKIGAWAEMLDNIGRDYILTVGSSTLQSKPVIVLSGTLRDNARKRVLREANRDTWPSLYPSHVKIAIARTDDEATKFGAGLPIRFEFWSDPVADKNVGADASNQEGRLVTLIELHAINRMKQPPMNRFLLDTQDAVNFVNETDRYLRQYGIHLTDTQKRQLLR